MTTRSNFSLKCTCGQTGTLTMSENDQPYSKCWEKYRVEGFNSKQPDVYAEGSISLGEAITRLSITCPACGATITQDNLKKD